ncbi:hypothetical protein J6590_033870 [Homalodisca vitripennis]|nr:hypothetical protein J6590_033870 [Homalodisca vitripennis]
MMCSFLWGLLFRGAAGHDLVGQDMPISGPSGRKTAGQKLEPAVITREMSSINNTHRCPASIQIRISGHKQSAFITAVKSGPFIGLLAPPVHPSYSGTYGQTINTWATVNSSGIVFNYSGDQKDLLYELIDDVATTMATTRGIAE